ncbi:flavin reductase family protein [Sphaerisporangium sp. TRM90804]|uniref:flavin reductase family protein n=1 Tax=Sphaerisporangium sp. TRM90804 TaxID=3031113 RepID=UPI00244D0E5A|nr:flavin reductase family protein [Sphaerisporangium sp. TRM90804]MDH2428369.1 flavin reductase family protein [Sphaerisporangium sp. TRM90804]
MTVENPEPRHEDPKMLRRAFGSFATGVTVVTTGGPVPHAMTANSFTSVSLEPPLVLICVDRGALMHEHLTSNGYFGVSVLASHQEGVAMHFANRWRTLGAAQFDEVDWTPGRTTGVPMLDGTLASFECELWRTYDGGDHTIFIGRIVSLHQQTDRDALLVFKGRFREISPDWTEVSA